MQIAPGATHPPNPDEVEIDFFQENVEKAAEIIRLTNKACNQTLSDLKWARKKQKSGGFGKEDNERAGRLIGHLLTLGHAPEIKYTAIKRVVVEEAKAYTPRGERVDCPCWRTGEYHWVSGCVAHPRESIS